MEISNDERLMLVNILRDYLDILREEEFKPCGRAGVERILDDIGIPKTSPLYNDTVEEITSKAISIWEIEQLVEILEKGDRR